MNTPFDQWWTHLQALFHSLSFVTDILPHILSVITLYMMHKAGQGYQHVWLIGMGNQVLWLLYTVSTETWGFLWLNLALGVVYFKNHLRAMRNVEHPFDD